ncbi:MAG: hypothetical protein KGI50_03725 [Patescibacteria group bacterium]|nr:hypothetical protein [Patescibacteria group bacterium]MDE2438398.1 hypothetical protein [Patescibacteria group bacterium]
MKHATIYKLKDDGTQTILATCVLKNGVVICTGNDIFVKNLEEEGIRDYLSENSNATLFPKDGELFIEQLPNNFRSGYLMAEIEEEGEEK